MIKKVFVILTMLMSSQAMAHKFQNGVYCGQVKGALVTTQILLQTIEKQDLSPDSTSNALLLLNLVKLQSEQLKLVIDDLIASVPSGEKAPGNLTRAISAVERAAVPKEWPAWIANLNTLKKNLTESVEEMCSH